MVHVGIADHRIQYETQGLDRGDLHHDPVEQLRLWYGQAEAAGAVEPNAMVVSTVGEDGLPDARAVLARDISASGVTFFTNRRSTKGRQIASSGRGAATFVWLELHRQVRIRGPISPVSDVVSDEYFATRPRASQIGAWASPQSEEITDRYVLEERLVEVEERFSGVEVPRPPHWGGYVVGIESIEFWQGRPSRLHDRFLYTRQHGAWQVRRLAP